MNIARPRCIVFSQINHCFYVSDADDHSIHKVSMNGISSFSFNLYILFSFSFYLRISLSLFLSSPLALFLFSSFSLPSLFLLATPYLNPFLAGEATVLAGSGRQGYEEGDEGKKVTFNHPSGMAVNQKTGMIYVVDTNNHIIRRVSPQGIFLSVSLFLVVLFNSLLSLSLIDFSLFIFSPFCCSCFFFSLLTIINIYFKGEVTVFAGAPGEKGLIDGNKSSSRFYFPFGICFDNQNHFLFITDYGNKRIRRVSLEGKNHNSNNGSCVLNNKKVK